MYKFNSALEENKRIIKRMIIEGASRVPFIRADAMIIMDAAIPT